MENAFQIDSESNIKIIQRIVKGRPDLGGYNLLRESVLNLDKIRKVVENNLGQNKGKSTLSRIEMMNQVVNVFSGKSAEEIINAVRDNPPIYQMINYEFGFIELGIKEKQIRRDLLSNKKLDVLFPFDPLPRAPENEDCVKIDYWHDSTPSTKQMTHFKIGDREQSLDLSEAHEFHVQYRYLRKSGYAPWTR